MSWDYLDEVDILPKLPPNFTELLESKKWQERKEALEALLKVLTDNERLSTKVSYAESISSLQTILAKDSNIYVQALAARCIAKFCTGLRLKFGSMATTILPVVFDKLKEKKPQLKDPLVECADALAATMASLETSQDDILVALGKPNPQIKQQTALFIARQMDLLSADKQPKKLIKALAPTFGKLSGDADADVRDASVTALGAIQRLVGEKNLRSMLGEVAGDEAKMKKVTEAAQTSAEKYAETSAQQQSSAPAAATTSAEQSSSKSAGAAGQTAKAPTAVAKEEDPWDFCDPFDVLSKMPADFDANIESKKWSERRDALQALADLIKANPKLEPKANYGELVGILKKVLEKDTNINVAALAANCLKGVADGLRAKFQSHAPSVVPIIFEKFKEKKPILRDPLVACIDSVAATTNLEAIGEDIIAALAKPNPNIKIQTDLFLCRIFKTLNSQTMPKKTLKALVPLLIKHSGDSDPEVRDACYAAMGSMMRAIGEKPSMQLLSEIAADKLKMDKVREFYQKALEEVGADVVAQMVQSVHKADAPANVTAEQPKKAPPKSVSPTMEDDDEALKPSAGSQGQKKPNTKDKEKEAQKAASKEDAENEPPTSGKAENNVLLLENGDKAQRIKDEKTLKTLKWNFVTPTEEHIGQLQQTLGQYAKVSLVAQLFSKDFKQHVKAVDELLKLGDAHPRVLLTNSDLLLKWCTLRFFETNPAALIKVLELCRVIAMLLQATETPMSVEELNAFVPYLLLKTGEAKETMRQAVRDIIDILTNIEGPGRMTPLVLDALKSKNARQRAECLLVVETYVSTVGIAPLKSASIEKLVAVHVGDKDVAVRNAAINVLVACYRFEGDQMWRNAGKMADKDRSLVEERIKRTGATANSKPPGGGAKIIVPEAPKTVVRRPTSHSRTRPADDDGDDEGDDDGEANHLANTTFDCKRRSRSSIMPDGKSAANRYALSEDYINGLDAQMNALRIEPPKMSGWGIQPTIRRTGSSSSISSIDTSDQLERAIQNISSGLPDVAKDAMFQVMYMLDTPEQRQLIERRMDLLFRMAAVQVEFIIKELETNRMCKDLIDALSQLLFRAVGGIEEGDTTIFETKKETVASLLTALLRVITLLGRDQEAVTVARSFNRLTMRILLRIELTSLLCGIVLGMKKALQQSEMAIAELFSKLLTKWDDELKKRMCQMRCYEVVSSFDEFYTLMLSEQHMDINNPLVVAVDGALEKVVLVQGDAVLDAARRLLKPQMHTTSFINKVLQTMKAEGLLPTLPGTLEEPMEEEKLASRPEVEVLVDNIIRDLGQVNKYAAKLIQLMEADSEAKKSFERYTSKVALGLMVRRLVTLKTTNPRMPEPTNAVAVERSRTLSRLLARFGEEADECSTPTPVDDEFNRTIIGDNPLMRGTPRQPREITSGSETISRDVRQPKRRIMSRAEFNALQNDFAQVMGPK